MQSAGKAAAAGLLLPVAVGVEIIAVPGTGWFMLYQLYKVSLGCDEWFCRVCCAACLGTWDAPVVMEVCV